MKDIVSSPLVVGKTLAATVPLILTALFALTLESSHEIKGEQNLAAKEGGSERPSSSAQPNPSPEPGARSKPHKPLPLANRPENTEEWLAAVDQAFAQPADPLKPSVLIFPVTDTNKKVVPNGVVMGYMALLAETYTPQRRLAQSPACLIEILNTAGCSKQNSVIDPDSIALCLKSAETPYYVLPTLTPKEEAYELIVAFHGNGKPFGDKTFTHAVARNELATVPGLIARDVLQHLEVVLTPDELGWVTRPQVKSENGLSDLDFVFYRSGPPREVEQLWQNFLRANPQCVFAWVTYLSNTKQPAEALKLLGKVQPAPGCDWLLVMAARQIRILGQAAEALSMLLPLVPSVKGDPIFHLILVRTARELGDERVRQDLFDRWDKEDPSYYGHVIRGREWYDWGYEARGQGFASSVTPENHRLFQERLILARRELTKALTRNPSGWQAHLLLERVAIGLGLPRDYLEDHFAQATRLRPRYLEAYLAKYQYLQPRWYGTPEDALAFGRECLATGYWEDAIPNVLLAVINDITHDPAQGVTFYRAFRSKVLWEAITDYYQQAKKNGRPEDKQRALNSFALWGIYGRHFEEVAPVYQELADSIYNNQEFYDFSLNRFEFFSQLVAWKTGQPPDKFFGKPSPGILRVKMALAEGDLDLAEKELARLDDAKEDRRRLESFRKAIQIGRTLEKDKAIDLSPEELKTVLDIRKDVKVDGDRLVLTLESYYATDELVFPLGLKHAVLSGRIELTHVPRFMIKTHAQAIRDLVTIDYSPDRPLVQLERNQIGVESTPFGPGPQAFRIEFGSTMDHIQPCPGVHWKAPVDVDIPSSFIFWGARAESPGNIAISNIHLELKD